MILIQRSSDSIGTKLDLEYYNKPSLTWEVGFRRLFKNGIIPVRVHPDLHFKIKAQLSNFG
ncbi:hypothetical protein COV24_04140, partial [candidate division WWE3 bacterium CG10_big_fil_rev_8_21_14_0_10_32_10]